jgi:hypothetical protein
MDKETVASENLKRASDGKFYYSKKREIESIYFFVKMRSNPC